MWKKRERYYICGRYGNIASDLANQVHGVWLPVMTTSRASWRIRYISQNRRVFRKQDTSKQTCVYQNRRVFIKTDVCLSKQTCVYQNRRVFMKQDTYACEQRHQCTWKKTPMHLKKKSDIAVFAYYVLYYYDSVCQLRHHRERFGAWYIRQKTRSTLSRCLFHRHVS